MDRLISLIVFHLKQYSKNSYFFVNVILSTATLILFQYIAASIYGETLHDVVWLRSGIFGLWAQVQQPQALSVCKNGKEHYCI